MPVDPSLHNKLQKKLGVGRRRVDQRIAAVANDLLLDRELAAIALAADLDIPIQKHADPSQLATIRAARNGRSVPEATVPGVSAGAPKARQNVPAKARSRQVRTTQKKTGKRVFVVHGRDEPMRRAMFDFLRAAGLAPMEWQHALQTTGTASPFIGDVLDRAFSEVVAVVVLFTGDDEARLREDLRKRSDPGFESELTPQSRPNVLFEAGMAFGHKPRNTVIVQVGDMRPISDLAGRHVVHLDNTPQKRTELINKLETAGCVVDRVGTDWYTAGDFQRSAQS